MQIVTSLEEEKTRIIKAGGSQAEDSKNLVRSVLSNIERKLDEEIGNRQKDLGETKDSLEQKLVNLLEKLKSDERQGLERERRLMEQVQDGLSTMNEIVKGTKEQSKVSLNHQTTIIGDQIGS